MLNLKVSKQTRSEASKNKVIIKRVSNISNKLSKSNYITTQISIQILQKSHIILFKKNIKLKEKYYIKPKNSFTYRKNCVLHHSVKINKHRGGGVIINSGGVRKKIEQLISIPLFIRYLRACLHEP